MNHTRIQAVNTSRSKLMDGEPGGHTTNMGTWWQAVIRDQRYIREQFAFYDADLVICCGSHVTNAFKNYIEIEGGADWPRTSRGVEYLEYRKRKFVVAYSHPEARIASNLIHYGLVDALCEIFRVNTESAIDR